MPDPPPRAPPPEGAPRRKRSGISRRGGGYLPSAIRVLGISWQALWGLFVGISWSSGASRHEGGYLPSANRAFELPGKPPGGYLPSANGCPEGTFWVPSGPPHRHVGGVAELLAFGKRLPWGHFLGIFGATEKARFPLGAPWEGEREGVGQAPLRWLRGHRKRTFPIRGTFEGYVDT